ncbi:uncharacterized protein LOC118417699 isoform X2 [Branchiostoma floridae]|uniref:Uncharacterized protein LOC118417699 isoform X2 n=2 Tax=Branchiostoma floridae TaxID=7739 RepID=A0A9J7LC27_BRAFL|nr:uncharacterized protein LOC118417699 isoform X2 [Branchiostoma floridae]
MLSCTGRRKAGIKSKMAGKKNKFFEDLAEVCPQMVGRELYLSLRPSVPERKFVLLSGGRIKDCHTEIIFNNRLKWLRSLADTVPEINALKEQQKCFSRISLANFSYTLPGRSGWRLEKIMRYIRINEATMIDVEMFFQPLKFGLTKQANSSQEGRNTIKSSKQSGHAAASMKGKEETVLQRRLFSNIFEDLVGSCPELVGREFYLSFKPPVPERKFVLLSGGKIKDCHTDAIFLTRGAWLKSLLDTVPEIRELQASQADFARTSLANFSYTLPGRSGWRLNKVMRYIRLNENNVIDPEMFFQPYTVKRGRKKKARPSQDSHDTDSTQPPGKKGRKMKKAEPHKESCDTGTTKKAQHAAMAMEERKTIVPRKHFSNLFEDLAEACPKLVGREFYLSFKPTVPERKFVLLSEGKVKDCHTNIVFDSRMKWLRSLADTVPEIKVLKEQQSTGSFTRISVAKFSYTLPGRSGWRMNKIMRYIRMNEEKTIDPEMFFQPYTVKRGGRKKVKPPQDNHDTDSTEKTDHTTMKEKGENICDESVQDNQVTDSSKKPEHTTESMKEKEKDASDMPPQDSQGTDSNEEPEQTAESMKETEKTVSDIVRHLVNTWQNEESELDQRNADPDHSYASRSQSKTPPSSCSQPTTFAEGTWFKEGESLSPEELVLYGLLLVKGKRPSQGKRAKLNCFTPQRGNNGGFTSVATAANCVSAASKYSAEGIKTYLSLAPHPVGRYKGKLRWEYFLPDVQQLVEKQGSNLKRLLSGVEDVDMQDIRDTAANICEENTVHQALPCLSNTALTLQNLPEVWKDTLRDQWNYCHLTCSQSEAIVHFLSTNLPSPVLQRTVHIHPDMTWTLKVRGLTCALKRDNLPLTVSHLSHFQTVLQFVQDGFVCVGCKV